MTANPTNQVLAYLRRGPEDGQDLATCFDRTEPGPCVSRGMDEAARAPALDE